VAKLKGTLLQLLVANGLKWYCQFKTETQQDLDLTRCDAWKSEGSGDMYAKS
jgi:hypothetical protein